MMGLILRSPREKTRSTISCSTSCTSPFSVHIETPRALNREQTEALKKFSETLGEGNYEKHRSFFGKKK